MPEQSLQHPASPLLPRWLFGFATQLGVYALLLCIGWISGIGFIDTTINERLALTIIIVFGILLLASIIYSLFAIVACRQMRLGSKAVAVLSSVALFASCFVGFYIVAFLMFVPRGLMLD